MFQSGMSNKIVESKWPGIRDGFHGFHGLDATKVVGMTPSKIDLLTQGQNY
jgi:3-methyladenine DNA glycosylase Tag